MQNPGDPKRPADPDSQYWLKVTHFPLLLPKHLVCSLGIQVGTFFNDGGLCSLSDKAFSKDNGHNTYIPHIYI